MTFHYLDDRIQTDEGWIAVCSCGWRSRKPLPSRGRAFLSFNAHGTSEHDRERLGLPSGELNGPPK